METRSRGWITRTYEFDAAHRVMHERVKCWQMHGHRYKLDITLSYDETHSIGYAMDFKEIKRVCCNYLDLRFDHGCILNRHDTVLIDAISKLNNVTGKTSKLHLMNLCGSEGFCNPSAENIAKELFFACSKLLNDPHNCNLEVFEVKLYETPNCWVTTRRESLSESDWYHLEGSEFAEDLTQYRQQMGSLEYDERKASAKDLQTEDVDN